MKTIFLMLALLFPAVSHGQNLLIEQATATRKVVSFLSESSGRRHRFETLSTGEMTYGAVMEANPDGSLRVPAKWITTNDAGYVIVFRPAGANNHRLVGNWHLHTDGWVIDHVTDDGVDYQFEIKSHGYFLHPQTGSTRHGRIDRCIRMTNSGSVYENLKITWMTNGNQLFAIYTCLLYTSPSPRDQRGSRMPSSA